MNRDFRRKMTPTLDPPSALTLYSLSQPDELTVEPVRWSDMPYSFDFRLDSIPLMYRGQPQLYKRVDVPNVDELYFNVDEHAAGFQQQPGAAPVAFRILPASASIDIRCQSTRCDLFDAGSGSRAVLAVLSMHMNIAAVNISVDDCWPR